MINMLTGYMFLMSRYLQGVFNVLGYNHNDLYLYDNNCYNQIYYFFLQLLRLKKLLNVGLLKSKDAKKICQRDDHRLRIKWMTYKISYHKYSKSLLFNANILKIIHISDNILEIILYSLRGMIWWILLSYNPWNILKVERYSWR